MASTNKGHFVWHDLMTKDPKAAIAFYSEVIGWKAQPFGQGSHYTMWVGSQGPLGGVAAMPEQALRAGLPPHWVGNVEVDDVDKTLALAKELGAKVHKEATDIPTVGRYAVLTDPQGAAIAVFTPGQAMPRHDTTKQGEMCWNELTTSDSAAAWSFYSELFGWKLVSEMEMGAMGSYRIFGVGEQQIGGMMNAPKGRPMPPAWTYYAETSDLDASIARATKMGAKVLNGPMDVPGGGRIAQMIDPQGAMFALHHLAKK